MGNNKTIGILLIIIGIAFIALGAWAGMPKTTTKTPSIYNEQNNTNTNTNTQVNDVTDYIYEENVNVYTESNEQESTRYIY